MKSEYDLANFHARQNPYASRLRMTRFQSIREVVKTQLSCEHLSILASFLLASLIIGRFIVYRVRWIPDHPSEIFFWGGVVVWSFAALPFSTIYGPANKLWVAADSWNDFDIFVCARALPIIVMQLIFIILYACVAWLCNALVEKNIVDISYYVGVRYVFFGMLLKIVLFDASALLIIERFLHKYPAKRFLVSLSAFLFGWFMIFLISAVGLFP